MDTTTYKNPNENYFNTPVISATTLGSNATPLNLAPTPTLSKPENLANFDIDSILNQITTPTSTQNVQDTALSKVGGLYQRLFGKSQDKQALEAEKGIPELNKSLTEAVNRFRTTTAEQNQLIQEQGAIPLALQEQATGRGITAGGLAPIQAGELRKNAIKQYQVTSRGLFQQAEIANLRDDIAGAQSAVDKAIEYKYAPIEQEIAYFKDFVLPTLKDRVTGEKADKLKALEFQVGERTRLLNNAKEDSKVGSELALVAMKNFPNDKQAQYNAQLAMQEAQKEQPDINKIFNLIGQYQVDPVATATALEELKNKRLQNAKLDAEAKKIIADTNASNIDVSKLDEQGKGILASVNNLRFSSVEESNRIRKNIANRLAQGDVQGALDDLKQFGYEKLSGSQRTDYDLYEGASSAFESASAQLNAQNLTAGPYKALSEKTKPFVSIKNDKAFSDLKSIIELGQAQLRKGFYGTAVTGTEAGNARNFLIVDSDPIPVIKWKLENGSNFLKWTNDATIARTTGLPKPNLDDYLTYRVRDKATGQTGTINRSEYNAESYEIIQ